MVNKTAVFVFKRGHLRLFLVRKPVQNPAERPVKTFALIKLTVTEFLNRLFRDAHMVHTLHRFRNHLLACCELLLLFLAFKKDVFVFTHKISFPQPRTEAA